jgi:hypothetical protein
MLSQVEEVRETQPDCRIYLALTKCDQLEELPSVGIADPDPEPDTEDSVGVSDCFLLCHSFHCQRSMRVLGLIDV